MTPPAILTIARLREAGACTSQVELFEQHFGQSVVVTAAKARKVAGLFDWNFAAEKLLDPAALATYNAATAPAWATYNAATAPAWATYNAARASARATYDAATASAWATYNAARAPAWARGYIATIRRAGEAK